MTNAVANVGDIVEAYCRRCRLNLDASVAALVGDEIVTVVCRTCDENQRYQPPRTERTGKLRVFDVPTRGRSRKGPRRAPPIIGSFADAAAAVGPVVRRPRRKKNGGRSPTFLRWDEMTDKVDVRYARPHREEESYDVGEAILHKKYGMGIVEELSDDGTLVAFFREGRQELKSRIGADLVEPQESKREAGGST